MDDKIRKLFETMAQQFLKLIEANNNLLEQNLKLMKELEEVKDGKKRD